MGKSNAPIPFFLIGSDFYYDTLLNLDLRPRLMISTSSTLLRVLQLRLFCPRFRKHVQKIITRLSLLLAKLHIKVASDILLHLERMMNSQIRSIDHAQNQRPSKIPDRSNYYQHVQYISVPIVRLIVLLQEPPNDDDSQGTYAQARKEIKQSQHIAIDLPVVGASP